MGQRIIGSLLPLFRSTSLEEEADLPPAILRRVTIPYQERETTLQHWQNEWESDVRGAWTHVLIPLVRPWLDRRHGEVDFYTTMFLSGHGYFRSYLHRRTLAETAKCWYHNAPNDDAEHSFFHCARWTREREILEEEEGEITPANVIRKMISDQRTLERIVSYIVQILKTKKLDDPFLCSKTIPIFMTHSEGWLGLDDTFATRAIHVGEDPDTYTYGPIVLPIYTTTTFKQDHPGKTRTYKYSRDGNPTRAGLESMLASLDDAKYGLAFASGTAAITAAAELVSGGGHVICSDQVFGGTYRYFEQLARTRHNISVTFITIKHDTNQAEEVQKAIQPNTKMVWFDGLSNPLMVVADIPRISEVLQKTNPDIILVIDNTFLSPYFSKPLKLGADVVVHSVTKYINGHADVTAGAVTTNNKGLYETLKFYQDIAGAVASPVDCSQIIRGAKTLEIRMQQHMKNAMQVAKFLENHANVEQVLYPGIKSHPQHELAKTMWAGASGMMSFYLNSSVTNEMSADIFLDNLKIFALGPSLGGVQSLAELPFKMLDEWMTQVQRYQMGVSENLIRISVGIENINSLIEDLDVSLNKITTSKKPTD